MTTEQNELRQFTFKDTGKHVFIKKVSPLLAAEVRKAFPPPDPPMNPVDYGDGKIKLEPNEADPEYARALEGYNIELEGKIRRLLVKRGCIIPAEEKDAALAEVTDLREFWQSEFPDKPLDADDTVVYVSYLCIGSGEDLDDFTSALLRRSQPTEKEIDESVKLFQP